MTDQHDVDERQRGDDVDRAALPQRHELRADDFGAGREQVDAGRVFALEDHEHEQPRSQQPVADQRQRDLARDAAAARADGARRLLELGAHLHQRRRDEPHAVGEPDDRVGEPHAEDRRAQRLQRREEQEHPQEREAGQQARESRAAPAPGSRRSATSRRCAGASRSRSPCSTRR